MKPKDIIKKPLLTEKATDASVTGKYTFLVDKAASKRAIAEAIGQIFNVQVKRVWTAAVRGKGKKAVVQLAEGEKIDLFEAPTENQKAG